MGRMGSGWSGNEALQYNEEPSMLFSHGHDDDHEIAVEGPEPKIPDNSDVVTKVVKLEREELKALEEPWKQLGHGRRVYEICVEAAPELKLTHDYVNVTKVAETEKEVLQLLDDPSALLGHPWDYEVIERAPEQKVPHNYDAIIRDADSLVDETSLEKLYDILHSGVFLNQKRKKYWVEAKSGYNCFMLFARALSITWSDDKRYWHWPYRQETNDVLVDVAELLKVCRLEVHGNFDITNFTPGVMYEIAFVVMLREPICGWEAPVNLLFTLPDGEKQERKVCLVSKPRGQWFEILVGKFRASPEKAGDIQFSLFELEGGQWKKGLVIKGVIIRPRNNIEEKLNKNCFRLIARDLSITWGENNCHWCWSCLKETNDVYVEVAELLKVCWLDVLGKFDTSNLPSGIMYEVAFIVMLKDSATGWEVPVHLRLALPDGKTQEHEEYLLSKPRGEWMKLKVGEFQAYPGKSRDIQFSLFEIEKGNWKSGLIIKGVTIRPKY
ncbi:uncharacterized protein LOC122093428 [Macadamia integrifolia]|uniref:uncharacterized protein LOC122093428 n=1 Tax=Macadamia integrifolia TaxID=60698 RepID=UPI001C52A81F|nr:uncharacterized protein LOC122093428 [Macadamia integrifolia]